MYIYWREQAEKSHHIPRLTNFLLYVFAKWCMFYIYWYYTTKYVIFQYAELIFSNDSCRLFCVL
jgi:hypothetical protein